MAKPLVLRFGETDLAFVMNKVDRSKLYGWKEVEVVDDRGRRCELATLASDGRTVVGRGGTALAQLAADATWCDKSQLRPVNLDGCEMQPVGSSFSAPVPVCDTVSVEEYLTHNIRLVYQMTCEEEIDSLRAELQQGTIYKFPYSYRGGLEADAGFLLMGEDGHIFFCVGSPTKVDFVGLAQVAVIEEESNEEEMDLMDFDMI